jgi:hypothetical protein
VNTNRQSLLSYQFRTNEFCLLDNGPTVRSHPFFFIDSADGSLIRRLSRLENFEAQRDISGNTKEYYSACRLLHSRLEFVSLRPGRQSPLLKVAQCFGSGEIAAPSTLRLFRTTAGTVGLSTCHVHLVSMVWLCVAHGVFELHELQSWTWLKSRVGWKIGYIQNLHRERKDQILWKLTRCRLFYAGPTWT